MLSPRSLKSVCRLLPTGMGVPSGWVSAAKALELVIVAAAAKSKQAVARKLTARASFSGGRAARAIYPRAKVCRKPSPRLAENELGLRDAALRFAEDLVHLGDRHVEGAREALQHQAFLLAHTA